MTPKHSSISPAFNRRQLLASGGAIALTAAVPFEIRHAYAADQAVPAQHIPVAPARLPLVGAGHPQTAVLAYSGSVPGPALRVRQGKPFQAVVENRLDEDTTVHWHGIRLPNAMDGVPGLTQPPIKSKESFTYEFTPPDAGTFWYHSHDNVSNKWGAASPVP